jgi:hypothetical protein
LLVLIVISIPATVSITVHGQEQLQQEDISTSPPTSQETTRANATEAISSDNSSAGTHNAMDVAVPINQSTAEAINYTEQAMLAMQNNDNQGAFDNLELALIELKSIQGNLTLSRGGINSSGIFCMACEQ